MIVAAMRFARAPFYYREKLTILSVVFSTLILRMRQKANDSSGHALCTWPPYWREIEI
jgi:hypothetical protein